MDILQRTSSPYNFYSTQSTTARVEKVSRFSCSLWLRKCPNFCHRLLQAIIFFAGLVEILVMQGSEIGTRDGGLITLL